jgi:hypothetical protein
MSVSKNSLYPEALQSVVLEFLPLPSKRLL